ncbi:hypothetical protein EDB82DRAFT_323191 [Fusarium venenatum]|uniref:uncharacterized protein n=1 Tax=Fusarium venenatum TaxID=56646 RepID=UPI001D710C86|nr:hypothetical protein EDB82DRAFT_323191 [Fusarium venenatum]
MLCRVDAQTAEFSFSRQATVLIDFSFSLYTVPWLQWDEEAYAPNPLAFLTHPHIHLLLFIIIAIVVPLSCLSSFDKSHAKCGLSFFSYSFFFPSCVLLCLSALFGLISSLGAGSLECGWSCLLACSHPLVMKWIFPRSEFLRGAEEFSQDTCRALCPDLQEQHEVPFFSDGICMIDT